MTLEEKEKLTCDMIRENPDATIKDFFDLVKDVDMITEEAVEINVSKRKEIRYNEIRMFLNRF